MAGHSSLSNRVTLMTEKKVRLVIDLVLLVFCITAYKYLDPWEKIEGSETEQLIGAQIKSTQ